uniref:Uncharacterized protein n=1 Tax=Rhipicephalus appendiculatus TaxID=34631 RepID=A0A131YSH4_RHIAP
MRMLRIVPLLIGFLAYNARSSQANSEYRYVVNGGALSGNESEDALMTPSSEDNLQREIPFVNRKDVAEEYDAANLKEGELGGSYNLRDSERSRYGNAEGRLSDGVPVLFVMPRRELEEYPMWWREQQEMKSQLVKRFVTNLFRKAGQSRSAAASQSATSDNLGSGDDFGKDHVWQYFEEPRRWEGDDTQAAPLSQLFRENSRQRGFDNFDVIGVQEDKPGLLNMLLGLSRRSSGRTQRMKGFSEVRSIPGRLPGYTRDYLSSAIGGRPNDGGRRDASIEIIRDGNRLGNQRGLLEGSADEEQLMLSTPNLRSEDISGVSGSVSSIARFLSLLERPRRYYGPRSHRSPILYRYRSFPYTSVIEQRGGTVGSGISRYWRHQPRLFEPEELLDNVGDLEDDNADGVYDNEFTIPTSKLGRARWKFYVYEGKPGCTHKAGISIYGTGNDKNNY